MNIRSLTEQKFAVSSLCSHGMSYPIAGNVKTHAAKGYSVEHPLVVSDEKTAAWAWRSVDVLLKFQLLDRMRENKSFML